MIVSVLIPAVQADPLLHATVASVREQDLPPEFRVEVVVALREPAAGTLSGVLTVPNPSGSIPAGLNAALARSTGEIILRVDARCILPPNYISRCVEHLERADIGMVGGAALVVDEGRVGEIYGIAFNSPLLGPSRYRYSTRSGPVDAAYLGAWRRDTLVDIGSWDERLLRNQDNELAERVRAADLLAWYDHELVVGYHAARSISQIVGHHHDFGRWRMAQQTMGQEGLSSRHKLFMAGVGLTAICTIGAGRRLTPPTRAVAAALAYSLAAAVASVTSGRLRARRPDLSLSPRLTSRLAAPLMAAAVDVAWVVGIVEGRVRPGARSPTGPGEASEDLQPEGTHVRPR